MEETQRLIRRDRMYKIGERINGMMKIAEVTTDTETGCLAFSAIIIAGSVLNHENGEETQSLNVEPMELYYIPNNSKKPRTIWRFNFNKQGHLAAKIKDVVVKRFVKYTGAELIDIKGRLEKFVANQFYEMRVDEIDAFVAKEEMPRRNEERFVSASEILSSKEMKRLFLRLKKLKEMKKLEIEIKGKCFDQMKKQAKLN